jgi:hypothetical protein
MTIHRDLLDGEMGTPPPSTVDVDAIIVRQRLQTRLRQAGLIGAVGAMTLAIVLVLTVLRPGGAPPSEVGGPPAPASPTQSLTPRQQEAARLTDALTHRLTQLLPDAEFLPPEWAAFAEKPPTEPLVFVDQGAYFYAAARIQDSAGIGVITVSVGKEDTQFRSERECSQDPPPQDMNVDCDVVPGPDGAQIETVNNSSKVSDYEFFAAEIIRADDYAVRVMVTNQSDEAQETFRPTPPLTFEQTLALAQSSELATVIP